MEKHKIEIYSPCYQGSRFEEHRFPIDLIDDLLMLRNMTIEMAKVIYLEEHKNRKRVPRNFTNRISIELESLGQGSTLPKLVLVSDISGLFPSSNFHYFEKAPERIMSAIAAAYLNQDARLFLPDSVLNFFNYLGSNLKDDEQIIFGDKEKSKAILNKESRKRLVLAASKSKQYTFAFELRGKIIALDKDRRTFEIQLLNGQKIKGEYQKPFLEVIQEAFVNLENNQKIWLKGTATFNAADKLQSIDLLEETILLDALDVPTRLEELSNLQEGWLDGEQGSPLDNDAIKWLGETFENNYNSDLPLPATFPTPDGNIQFEWSLNHYEISLTVDLSNREAEFYAINTQNGTEKASKANLAENEGWILLNQLMLEIYG